VEFSLWKSLVRAIKPPIYRGPLFLYFPAQKMFLRFSLWDSLRTYYVSRRVVMQKSSRTVGCPYSHFWHGFQVLFKLGHSFCTLKKSPLCMLKKVSKCTKRGQKSPSQGFRFVRGSRYIPAWRGRPPRWSTWTSNLERTWNLGQAVVKGRLINYYG